MNATDPDVDHGGARFNPIALDHWWPPDGRHYDFSASNHRREILRLGMRYGHRAIIAQQQLS
jgi:hypothetical protein